MIVSNCRKPLYCITLLLVIGNIQAIEDLRKYVCVVWANTHENTLALYTNLAAYFQQAGNVQSAEYFQSLAGSKAFGSGFVVFNSEGQPCVVTNRHVVDQAVSATLAFENPEDGSKTTYENCPLLYVSYDYDLAIVDLPENVKKKFTRGLVMNTEKQPIQTKVFAAGFPGQFSRPSYRFTQGNITSDNIEAPELVNPKLARVIEHDASIDHGNSGGALVVENKNAPCGYEVIGVNTWSLSEHQNANFAIPASAVKDVLSKAAALLRTKSDTAAVRGNLEHQCNIFVDEMNSDRPDYTSLYQYISYQFVAKSGWDTYLAAQQYNAIDSTFAPEVKLFYEDPVKIMKFCLLRGLQLEQQAARLSGKTFQFKRINSSDADNILDRDSIRSLFTLGDNERTITWIREYGYWRIYDMDFNALKAIQALIQNSNASQSKQYRTPTTKGNRDTSAGTSVSEVGGSYFGIGPRIGAGFSTGYGKNLEFSTVSDVASIYSGCWGIAFDYIAGDLGFETGLNFTRKGVSYTYDVSALNWTYQGSRIYSVDRTEKISIIQIPLMGKFKSKVFYCGAGFGFNFVFGRQLDQKDESLDMDETYKGNDSYLKDLKGFQIPLLVDLGFEFPVGMKGTTRWGLFTAFNYDLANAYSTDNLERYWTLQAGTRLLFSGASQRIAAPSVNPVR